MAPQSFQSSIPEGARARIVERHPSGAKARADYLLAGKVVGYRLFDAAGELIYDCGLRDGRPHGMAFRLDAPGRVLSAIPYAAGLEHGLARQWSADGRRVIGSYRMRHGTGIDLWWQETFTNPPRRYLAEVRYVRKGQLHGFEWWLNEDQRSVYQERHWRQGKLHGIEREWNRKGGLRRGYPRFFVGGERVGRTAYERAQATDPSLPQYRAIDDRNPRAFPPAIARRLWSLRRPGLNPAARGTVRAGGAGPRSGSAPAHPAGTARRRGKPTPRARHSPP
jgi:antitoxin component YwqK of YwqJK toxin-antitoxin module